MDSIVDSLRRVEEVMMSAEIRADRHSRLRARVTLFASLLALLLIFVLRLIEMIETPEVIPTALPRALHSCLMTSLPVLLLKRMRSVEVPTALLSFGVVWAFSYTMWNEGGLESINLLFIALVPALVGFIASPRVFWLSMLLMFLAVGCVGYATLTGTQFALPVSKSVSLSWSATVGALIAAAFLAWFIHTQLRTSLRVQEQELAERRRVEDLLRASTLRAEAANRSKDAFLAYISHEIRNPLTSILGAVELFSNNTDEVQHARYLPALEASGNTLLRLVNRLLDLSKLQAGRVDLEVNRVHVAQVIEEMVSTTRGYVGSLPVEVAGRVHSQVPGHVGIDETRIRQVLSNLLSNAAKNTHEGRIDIEVMDVDGRALHVTISDTGLGIPREALEQVFEQYTQVGVGSDASFAGTGLGLSIVREGVKLMGGEAAIESELGKGTQVSVTLPYTTAPEAESFLSRTHTVRVRPSRILLAEDEEANRAIVTAILESLDQEVVQVSHGGQAVEETALGGLDLVLMDMRMPGVDGLTAIRRIREREAEEGSSPVPIVALTANPERLGDGACHEAGVDAVLAKPVSRQRLAEVLEHYLGSAEAPGHEEKTAVG